MSTDQDPLTYKIIDCAIEVHRELGPGYLESVYKEALVVEFQRQGIRYSRQHGFNLLYKGVPVGTGRLDFLIEGEVILELKAVETLAPIHTVQVLSYLKATNLRKALLINFKVEVLKNGIARFVL